MISALLGASVFLIVTFLSNVWTEPSTRALFQLQAQEPGKIDVAASAKHLQASNRALAAGNLPLAKEECEAALMLNLNSIGAKKLLEKIQKATDELDRLIEKANSFFESGQNEDAVRIVSEIRLKGVNYPNADALIEKAVGVLVEEGWDFYWKENVKEATAKVKKALEFNPEDPAALELWNLIMGEKGVFTPPPETAGVRAVLEYKGIEFAFRYCPPGVFRMGSPDTEEGRENKRDFENQHAQKIEEGFWICETEITQEQWDAVGFISDKECSFKGENLPVENLSLVDCVGFVELINSLEIAPKGWKFAVPTSEQWEYACRAGTGGTTYGPTLDVCAWYGDNSDGTTHKVATKEPNEWGIYDMLGNVDELTDSKVRISDGYGNSSSYVVCRGGNWRSGAVGCRPAAIRPIKEQRFENESDVRCHGFRCVLIPVKSN